VWPLLYTIHTAVCVWLRCQCVTTSIYNTYLPLQIQAALASTMLMRAIILYCIAWNVLSAPVSAIRTAVWDVWHATLSCVWDNTCVYVYVRLSVWVFMHVSMCKCVFIRTCVYRRGPGKVCLMCCVKLTFSFGCLQAVLLILQDNGRAVLSKEPLNNSVVINLYVVWLCHTPRSIVLKWMAISVSYVKHTYTQANANTPTSAHQCSFQEIWKTLVSCRPPIWDSEELYSHVFSFPAPARREAWGLQEFGVT
jgi:hypothetical protein